MLRERISLAALAGLWLMAGLAGPAGAQVPRQTLQPAPTHWLQFGYAIDASADTLIVGAPDSVRNNDTSNCQASPIGFGVVGVYKKAASDWVLSQELWHDFFPATDTTGWEPRFGSRSPCAATRWP